MLDKRTCAFVMWIVMVALLASCGPTDEPRQAPTQTPTPPRSSTSKTPEASTAGAVCRGRIAFVGRNDGEKDIFVVNADGSGLVNVTNDAGWELYPSWSPDGSRILFARHEGNSDIYTIRADGSELVRLTDNPAQDYSPTWSPDGKQVLFVSTRVFASDIFVVSAEGGEAVPLTGQTAHKTDFTWSPDGSHIAFTMLDGYNQGDIFVMKAPDEEGAGAGEPTNLTQHPANDCCVAWSPDGEHLLFLSSRNGKAAGILAKGYWNGSRYADLPVRAGQDGASNTVADVVRPVTTVMPEQPRDIYVMRYDGSEMTRLTDGRGHAKDASWSPDGTRIAFVSDWDGNDEIYVMAVPSGADVGDSSPIRLTDSPADDGHPTWSPDGSCLAFTSYRDGAVDLSLMNADGTGLRRLADNGDWTSDLSWSP